MLRSAPPTRTAAGRQELLTRREELCSLACVCECAGWYRKPVEILSKDKDVLPRIPDRVDLSPGNGARQLANGRVDSPGLIESVRRSVFVRHLARSGTK